MPRPKKTYKIKRTRPRAPKQAKVVEDERESSEEEMKSEREVPEVFDPLSQHFKEETPISRAVKIDPRKISNLPD